MTIGVVDCNVDLMNVFTPNGDGLNDIWFVAIESPRRFILRIYNRWGTLIFESEDVNQGWDGTNQNTGRACSEGGYAFILELINFEGAYQNYSGTITLIRD
jgi:gliding motility-associated-like protein